MLSSLSLLRRLMGTLATALLCVAQPLGATDALRPDQLPKDLQGWVPWAMQGHENLACPGTYDDHANRHCVWPNRLDLSIDGRAGHFSLDVEVIGTRSAVMLPGEAGAWPEQVRNHRAEPLPVATQQGRPVVWLPPGKYLLQGRFDWQAQARTIRVPTHTGLLSVQVNGRTINPVADGDDRIWLQGPQGDPAADPSASNTQDITIRRLIDDDIPRRITTRYELNVAGQPREIELPAALLAATQPEALRSNLPARLYPDGRLQVQLRAGSWQIEVDARQMKAVRELRLPDDAHEEEVWSYRGHNALHVTQIEGVEGIDPQQANVPRPWQRLPAYRMQPDSTMQIIETTRGDTNPSANRLQLERELWLDFDGGGFTQKDHLSGMLSGEWRLQQSGPAVLGYASTRGEALPISRLDEDAAATLGVELRHRDLSLTTLSRIEGRPDNLSVNGWNTVLSSARTTLHLPPGWTLLGASGVDDVSPPTWSSRWRLFDVFFVLLGAIGAFRLLGPARGVLLAGALVLSWYEFAFIGSSWLLLLLCLAMVRVLPGQTRAYRLFQWGGHGLIVLMLLALLPFTVQETRQIIYPTLEHSVAYDPSRQRTVHEQSEAMSAAATGKFGLQTEADPSIRGKARRAAYDLGLPGNQASIQPLKSQQPVHIQTGPGMPAWHWNQHTLSSRGDIQPDQSMNLYLLPPLATALHKVLLLTVLYAALWTMFRSLPALRHKPGKGLDKLGVLLLSTLIGLSAVPEVRARDVPNQDGIGAIGPMLLADLNEPAARPASPTADEARAAAPSITPARQGMAAPPIAGGEKATLMQELRDRLHPPPDCQPNCAALAHLRVFADRRQLRLQLNLHVQTLTQVPLPGVDSSDNWRMVQILHNGRAATLRRDALGKPWILLARGIHSVELSGSLGNGASVRIPLPLRPSTLTIDSQHWQARDLDAAGLPQDGMLNLDLPLQGNADNQQQLAHVPDALPGFALVERTLIADDRWQVQTRISRQGVSLAPIRVRFALLPGESVNDERVQVHDGIAELQLGQAHQVVLNSTMPIGRQLVWRALPALNQIERWQLRYSSRWHPSWKELTPIHYADAQSGLLAPLWQPWPGEELKLHFVAPKVITGPTLTQEHYTLEVTPGEQSSHVQARIGLRASLAGMQSMQLPAGVEFLGMTLDGTHVPLQPNGNRLDIPVVPGEHEVVLRWREPQGASGIGRSFATRPLDTGLPGVNAITSLELPYDRVVLAAGGPPIGPAVLFWGFVPLLMLAAVALTRCKRTPLGVISWFLLLLGLAQTSLTGALLVAGWFVALGLRPPVSQMQARGWNSTGIRMVQVALGLWTLLTATTLYHAVHTALLGYPDMLITGNDSSAHQLFWYQDRFDRLPEASWVFSISLTTYRVAMLIWALWLASVMIGWCRWAWQRFSAGGHWVDDDPPPGSGGAGRPDGDHTERVVKNDGNGSSRPTMAGSTPGVGMTGGDRTGTRDEVRATTKTSADPAPERDKPQTKHNLGHMVLKGLVWLLGLIGLLTLLGIPMLLIQLH
ncbi:MAG: hypothetical protein Q4A16_00830 [Lautropia sp.]|nr:hypothetical protein [Lautropia sp.]